MAQNISIMGASYEDVPSVTLPKTGGGTAQFDDTTDANAIAADIAQGKTAWVNGLKLIGTASGGGGASNIVTGTFKGTTTGAAMDINLDYSGSGYPVAVVIYPKDGFQSGSSFYSTVQRYAMVYYMGIKRTSETPTYASSGANNQMVAYGAYKNSSSTGSNIGGSSTQNTVIMKGVSPSDPTTPYATITFKTSKKLSVFIASSSYGFAANIEYTYHVIYSS